MKGWGAALLCVAFVMAGCTTTIDMVPITNGAIAVATTRPAGPPGPQPAPRAGTVARANPDRGFPYPLQVQAIPTPVNHDATRGGASVDYVVIHYTVITYDQTIRAFNNPNSEVSAHYVVRGDGHVAEIVSPDDVAWHSGNSWFNDHSVGIELELNKYSNPAFTVQQYQAAALLVCEMSRRYGVPLDRAHIVGHNEVPGSTHTDPGPTWGWDHFMWLVRLCAYPTAANVRAQFVSQTPYPTIPTNRVASVSVALKNTGSTTWRKGTPTEARLAIKGNSDGFAFLDKGWVAPDRPAVQHEAAVEPGQTATFTFQIRGTIPGRYVLPLQGVIDGGAWMNDLGLYAVVTVR